MQVSKPTVPEVLPVARAYYAIPGNGAGGCLHIVLEDGNISDADVRFCADLAETKGDLIGHSLAVLLGRMSRTQRSKLRGQLHQALKTADANTTTQRGSR